MNTNLKVLEVKITYEGGLSRTIGGQNAEKLMTWLRGRFWATYSSGNYLDDALNEFPLKKVDNEY